MYTLSIEDLTDIYERLGSFWPKGQNFLISGGTGFFGRWLVESICFIEKKLNNENNFYILTRQTEDEVIHNIPILSEFFFHIIQSDIEKKINLKAGFDYVIHAAADVSAMKKNSTAAQSKSVENMISVLDRSRLKKFLYVSSGAVYNKKNDEACNETDLNNLDFLNVYTQEKILNENTVIQRLDKNQYNIARCFSFLGPFTNSDMIAMQMLHKKIKNETISLSLPDAKRSYMYPTDLVVNLFQLLLNNTKHNIYNIGSDQAITLEQLADQLNINTVQSEHHYSSLAGKYYYPNTNRINSEFKNMFTTDLKTVLQKTLNFEIERLKK